MAALRVGVTALHPPHINLAAPHAPASTKPPPNTTLAPALPAVTGMAGLLSALGTEYVAPPLNLSTSSVAAVSFCINGKDDELKPGEGCPLPAARRR